MKVKNTSQYIFIFFLIVILWHIASAVVKSPLLPPPAAVFYNLREVFFSKIAPHAALSIYRIIAGLIFSVLIGSILGLLMGFYHSVDRVLSPVIYFIYPIPKIALLPIVMILFGLGELSKITMIVIITVFQIIITMRDTVKNIPKEMFYSLTSLGAGDIVVFKEIILPAAAPELLTALRLGTGTAISVLFFTENFGTVQGIGYFIMDAWMRVNYIDMYSGILVLGGIGLILFSFVDALDRIFCRWKK
ncbi:ABC transporter permease [Thermosediminibacter oceani]|uniref:Binding-protein-dependent transport systems inner membrane component n=1 Tax=Thermosediminibacter oceani (strain ATCC BAA-1034 / DSM 16646 / JW/IW-1228P) TaxID=555079 RepID=D9RXM5_THEOJ|nr:ABC transporter permease [Thermosediminibacter oceani]ADL08099.1 binding-protein-dependent transport systems inner membrane component [Thermosediminibacter oceani DSM 16646]